MGSFASHLWREDQPRALDLYRYDHRFGFEDRPRKEKVMPATYEEMESAGLDHTLRDFCAKIRIELEGCWHAQLPFLYRCKGLRNELHDCYLSEYVDDMKEFEREKRLNQRERRIREGLAK